MFRFNDGNPDSGIDRLVLRTFSNDGQVRIEGGRLVLSVYTVRTCSNDEHWTGPDYGKRAGTVQCTSSNYGQVRITVVGRVHVQMMDRSGLRYRWASTVYMFK